MQPHAQLCKLINKGAGIHGKHWKRDNHDKKDFKGRMDTLEEIRKTFLKEVNGSENEP